MAVIAARKSIVIVAIMMVRAIITVITIIVIMTTITATIAGAFATCDLLQLLVRQFHEKCHILHAFYTSR